MGRILTPQLGLANIGRFVRITHRGRDKGNGRHAMLGRLVGGTYSVAYIQPLGHGHPEPIRWEYVRDCTGRNVEPLRCT